MILTCIYFLRGRDVLVLVILKTLLTAFLLGTLSSLLFSLFGSLFSFIVMFALVKLGRKNSVSSASALQADWLTIRGSCWQPRSCSIQRVFSITCRCC